MFLVHAMPTAAYAAHNAAPMTQLKRRVAPQARHEDAEEREAEPPFAAILVRVGALARGRRKVTLRVRHAMVQHALCATDARYCVYRRFYAIRCVFAATSGIFFFGV